MTTNLDARLSSYSSPVLSIFRIVFGLLFTLHGSTKLFGWPLGTSVPVGTWPAWWAGLIEFVTGLLITVGLFTRIAAFIASGHMAVAYFWKHWPPLDGGPRAVSGRSISGWEATAASWRSCSASRSCCWPPPAPAPFRWMPGGAARSRRPHRPTGAAPLSRWRGRR